MDTYRDNPQPGEQQSRLASLRDKLDLCWARNIARSNFFAVATSDRVSRSFYALYLCETYQYTRHNARNQALVAARPRKSEPQYQQFCLRHAADETGHELMALHDIRSLDRAVSIDLPPPLPETTVLIAYLYWISITGSPHRRLGYSFWAESCYQQIMPALLNVKRTLELSDAHMTFFMAHAEIDADHAKDVDDMIIRMCKTDGDWEQVEEVMTTSLSLTFDMMDAVSREHQRLVDNDTKRADFILAYDRSNVAVL